MTRTRIAAAILPLILLVAASADAAGPKIGGKGIRSGAGGAKFGPRGIRFSPESGKVAVFSRGMYPGRGAGVFADRFHRPVPPGFFAPGIGFGGYYERDSLYGRGFIPIPPYYALHPPVYYSRPVPRTYGYSPYAYPESVMTPELKAPPAKKMVLNPYYRPKAEEKEKKPATRQASAGVVKPLTVVNPYYQPKHRLTADKAY